MQRGVFEFAVYRGIRSRLVSPLPHVRIDVPISKILRPNRPKKREQVEFHPRFELLLTRSSPQFVV